MAIRSWQRRWQDWTEAFTPALAGHLSNTVRNNWHLGLTAFGGPPVHFKIVRTALFATLTSLAEKIADGVSVHSVP